MTVELAGRVALVTGSSRGIGAAIAQALAGQGCAVACAARSTAANPTSTPGTLDAIVDQINGGGGRAIAIPTNLAVDAEVELMVETTVDTFGGIDILVNNAGITIVGDLEIPMKRFDLVMQVNVRGPMLATRAAVPHMRKAGRGHIINVSSLAALLPVAGTMAYGMSKIALEHFTMHAARELQEDGIQVNAFRIDLPIASEGFVANTPGRERGHWEPCEVAAEGVLWMLAQPTSYSGRRESMLEMRQREGIMASRASQPFDGRGEPWHPDPPIVELYNGLAPVHSTTFRESSRISRSGAAGAPDQDESAPRGE
jgi:NAD(P)-dependent dehydrogenase (short-subunit alcohol dehydrogenase family)